MTQMRQNIAGKTVAVEGAIPGDFVIVYGLNGGKIGDVVGDYTLVPTEKYLLYLPLA